MSSWTPKELEVLRTLYPVGGWEAVQAELPHHPRKRIYNKASELKIRCSPRQAEPEVDATAVGKIVSHYPDVRSAVVEYMQTKSGHACRFYRGKNGITLRPLGRMVLEAIKPFEGSGVSVLDVAQKLIEARRA